MKVFLDTNVLASAFATRGLCSDVLREVFASHDLYTSIEVLKELRVVLKNKFGFPENLIKKIFCCSNAKRIWLIRKNRLKSILKIRLTSQL